MQQVLNLLMTININRAVQFAVKNGWNAFRLYS